MAKSESGLNPPVYSCCGKRGPFHGGCAFNLRSLTHLTWLVLGVIAQSLANLSHCPNGSVLPNYGGRTFLIQLPRSSPSRGTRHSGKVQNAELPSQGLFRVTFQRKAGGRDRSDTKRREVERKQKERCGEGAAWHAERRNPAAAQRVTE